MPGSALPAPGAGRRHQLVGAENEQPQHQRRRRGDPGRLDADVPSRIGPAVGSGRPLFARHVQSE